MTNFYVSFWIYEHYKNFCLDFESIIFSIQCIKKKPQINKNTYVYIWIEISLQKLSRKCRLKITQKNIDERIQFFYVPTGY